MKDEEGNNYYIGKLNDNYVTIFSAFFFGNYYNYELRPLLSSQILIFYRIEENHFTHIFIEHFAFHLSLFVIYISQRGKGIYFGSSLIQNSLEQDVRKRSLTQLSALNLMLLCKLFPRCQIGSSHENEGENLPFSLFAFIHR